MPGLPFTKMHALGNNYIYVDRITHPDPVFDWPAVAAAVSDPNTGIGSDGLILMEPSSQAALRMRMFNADGSEGEMCGNGIRSVAKYAVERDLVDGPDFLIETKAGLRQLQCEIESGRVVRVQVGMGRPGLRRKDVPVAADDPEACGDLALNLDGIDYRLTALSMGNPHAVLFVPDVDTAPVSTLGPKIEAHAVFPERTNVEFVQVLGSNALRMRVWERGSGETQACGTGACAALVAAVLGGKTGRQATIHLLGGRLDVAWGEDDEVVMTGGASYIATGELSAEWFAEHSIEPVTEAL